MCEQIVHLVTCPNCDSHKIYRVRHDSDWGSTNTMYRVNPEKCYGETEEKEEYGDIEFYYCDDCWYEFF